MATSTAPAATITDQPILPVPAPTLKQSLAAIAAPGIAAVKRTWIPFTLIQLCALGLVVAYFRAEPVRHFCDVLARWKSAGGYAFSAIAYGLAGGMVPDIVKFLVGKIS